MWGGWLNLASFTNRRQIERLEKAGICLEGVFIKCLWEWGKHLGSRLSGLETVLVSHHFT